MRPHVENQLKIQFEIPFEKSPEYSSISFFMFNIINDKNVANLTTADCKN